MSYVLARIAIDVEKRLNERRQNRSLVELRKNALQSRMPQSLAKALAGNRPKIIAEVKLASPSEGAIALKLNPVEVAEGYLHEGAAAISVLTEQDHFGGSYQNLILLRERFPEAVLLMKDFVIDSEQLLEARSFGADAVLLIVALLGEERCAQLMSEARALGLSTLVEVHDEEEMRIASRLKPEVIGVNNRDLRTLKVSLDVSRRLAPLAPEGAVLVSESGLTSSTEIVELHGQGYSAFLMGTHFMKTQAPGAALARLMTELASASSSAPDSDLRPSSRRVL